MYTIRFIRGLKGIYRQSSLMPRAMGSMSYMPYNPSTHQSFAESNAPSTVYSRNERSRAHDLPLPLLPASPLAALLAPAASTFLSGRYSAFHICTLIHSSSSPSSSGIPCSCAKPSATAFLITAAAILTLISRTRVTSGSRPASGSLSAGAQAASALVAATRRGGARRRVRERTTPRPGWGGVSWGREARGARLAYAWEGGGVVAFGDFSYSAVFCLDWREGRAGGCQHFAIRPLEQVFGVCFVQASRVAEREDDRAVYVLGHFLDYLFREALGFGGRAYQDVRLDMFHNLKERLAIYTLKVSVRPSVRMLSRCEVVLHAL